MSPEEMGRIKLHASLTCYVFTNV